MHCTLCNYFINFKALPQVCTESTAQGGMLRDKYSTRRHVEINTAQGKAKCYIYLKTHLYLLYVKTPCTNTGSTLSAGYIVL